MVKWNPAWLTQQDGQGFQIKDWAVKVDDCKVECKFCFCRIDFSVKGAQSLTQHAKYEKHKSNYLARKNQTVLVLPDESNQRESACDNIRKPASENASSQIVGVYHNMDSTTKAEIIWTLKCVVSDFSFNSCHDIGKIFATMFSSCNESKNFTLGATKTAYLLTEAIAPYFKKLQEEELEGSYYTLMYDETTNAAGHKELQVFVRYWSKSRDAIVVDHLDTWFIGHATADDLSEKLMKSISLSGLSLNHLLMLGSDGPNVNKKVFKIINNEVNSSRKKPLIDIGTCNIHACHNAYRAGLDSFGSDSSELLLFLHRFFDDYPSRWEDFCVVLDSFKSKPLRFTKHIPARWLTLQAACERALTLWEPTKEYFLKFLPKKKSNLLKQNSYRRIVKFLENPTMKAEIIFIGASAELFSSVTLIFQSEQPRIHELYSALIGLVTSLVNRSCKEKSLPLSEIFSSSNLLPPEDVIIPEDARVEIASMPEGLKKTLFFKEAQCHYIAAGKYLIKKSSLGSDSILKDLVCLGPEGRISPTSNNQIASAARKLPWPVKIDVLLDEWQLLKMQKDTVDSKGPIDEYWAKLLSCQKYPTTSKVVKALLALSHGNADVERAFSISANVMTEIRSSLHERTMNALIKTKYALKKYKNNVCDVPITKELLASARSACASYKAHLEEERKKKEKILLALKEKEIQEEKYKRRQKEMEETRNTLKAKDKILMELKKNEEDKSRQADTLLNEATKRLEKAVKSNNKDEIALATAMLTAVTQLREQASSTREIINKEEKVINKRKSTLLDYVVKKPKK